jgi:hypothetical protein
MGARDYLEAIKLKLALSPAIKNVHIVHERALDDKGFFRARLWLTNGDFLEVAEFFKVEGEQTQTVEYRYQWMDASKEQLRKRWDNAPHYPDVPNFPHHVHAGNDEVRPGKLMNIITLLDLIEREIGATS